MKISKNKKIRLQPAKDGSLFLIYDKIDSVLLPFQYWEQTLGHLPLPSIENALPLYADSRMLLIALQDFHCSQCSIPKDIHSLWHFYDSQLEGKLDLIRTDSGGPFPLPSYTKSWYYSTFVDDGTRVTWAGYLKHKSEASRCIQEFLKDTTIQYSITIKCFWHDNSGEHSSARLKQWPARQGITHDLPPLYFQKSNGVAEPINRGIADKFPTMLESAIVSEERLMAKVVWIYTHPKNHQSYKAIKHMALHEMFYGKKHSINHLQPFGRECYINASKENSGSGSKLPLPVERNISNSYRKASRQYHVFSLTQKHVFFSSKVFFPSHKSEGITPSLNRAPDTVSSFTISTSISGQMSNTCYRYKLLNWCNKYIYGAVDGHWQGYIFTPTLIHEEMHTGNLDRSFCHPMMRNDN